MCLYVCACARARARACMCVCVFMLHKTPSECRMGGCTYLTVEGVMLKISIESNICRFVICTQVIC